MKKDKVLIIDDEPEYLNFLFDFFESQNFKCIIATNLTEAMNSIDSENFLLALVDMNIPATGTAQALLDNPISKKYPGFKAAHHLRNKGYGAHQVIAYTVHDDDSLDSELNKIRCRYVLKGRPEILKNVIRKSLGPKPKNS